MTPFIRKLVVDMLKPLGYRLVEAENAETALKTGDTFEGVIDVLLTDVLMPGMNGKELADVFLSKHPGTKVVFMSGYTADAIAYRVLLAKETAFIQKPLTLYKLAGKVREVLDRNAETE